MYVQLDVLIVLYIPTTQDATFRPEDHGLRADFRLTSFTKVRVFERCIVSYGQYMYHCHGVILSVSEKPLLFYSRPTMSYCT